MDIKDTKEKLSFWDKLRGADRAKAEGADASRLWPSAGENYAGPGLVMIVRLAISAALILLTTLLMLSDSVAGGILIASAAVSGYDLVLNAAGDIRERAYLRENLLVSAASVIAFCSGLPLEGALAPLILQIVYILRDYVQCGMKRSLASAMDPDGSGDWDAAQLVPGASLSVGPDMIFPADCVVTDGTAYADFSFLTGDSALRSIGPGSFAPAGCKCADGTVTVQVISEPEQAICIKFASALRQGTKEPTAVERKWTKLTKPLVPAALTLCAVLLIAMPLSGAAVLATVFHRVAAILVIASPAGILLTIPSAYYVGTAVARKRGAVVMGAQPLEKLSDTHAVVFAKSGTLTEKTDSVAAIRTDRMDPATFLKVAAHAEAQSHTETAKSIIEAYGGELDLSLVQNFRELPGGVIVTVDGIPILLGSEKFLRQAGVAVPSGSYSPAAVHMTVSGIYAGRIELSETVSHDAVETVHALSRFGVERVAMVTGDGRERSRRVASELAIDEYYAECTPAEQGKKITDMKSRLAPNSTLAFVGSPESPDEAFKAADVGIEIGSLTLGNGLRPADIFILGESTLPIAPLLDTALETKHYASVSAAAASAAKLVLIILAAVGITPLWFTLVVDACVSNGLVVNALTLASAKEKKKA